MRTGGCEGEAELSHSSQISITLNYFFKAFKNSHRNALYRVLVVLKPSQCQYFNAVNLSKLNSGSEISNEAKLSVCKCVCVCAHANPVDALSCITLVIC